MSPLRYDDLPRVRSGTIVSDREAALQTGSAGPASPSLQRGRIYMGWKVLALTMLMSICAAGPVYYAYGNYALAFSSEFGASRTTINFGYTVVMLVGNLGSAPVGWLLDRWPVRRVALAGALGTGAGLALVAGTTQMWQVLLLFTTLIALADVFLGVVMVNYLLSHWFERRRGLALSFAQIGSSGGAIIFPPLTAFLTVAVGWRSVFLIYGALVVVLVLPILIYARLPSGMPDEERSAVSQIAVAHASGRRHSYATIWRNAPFWIITVCTGTMIGINGGTMISLVPYAKSLGLDVSTGAFLLSIIGIVAVSGKLVFGLVADRIDLKWAMRGSLLLVVAGQLLFAVATPWAMRAGAVLFGLSLGGMLPVWGLVSARVFGLASYGVALGGTRTAMTPLAFVCPMLAGIIFDRFGSYQWAWLCFAALALFACGLTFISRTWADPLEAR
jgi:MFS family permease